MVKFFDIIQCTKFVWEAFNLRKELYIRPINWNKIFNCIIIFKMKKIVLIIFTILYACASLNLLIDVPRDTSFIKSDSYIYIQTFILVSLAMIIYFLSKNIKVRIPGVFIIILLLVFLFQLLMNYQYYLSSSSNYSINFESHRNDTSVPASPKLFYMGLLINVVLFYHFVRQGLFRKKASEIKKSI